MIADDPLKSRLQGGEPPALRPGRVALLCIDLQYHDAAEGHGLFAGLDPAERPRYADYFDRLRAVVLPAVARLQATFRDTGHEVIHIRIRSLTRDGRDRSPEHKRIGTHVAPGSPESEFLPEVAPLGDEIVIDKTASGVFNATNLDYVLRNLGITQLVVTGVVTNECVETAVRDAADRGYTVFVPEDGCAAVAQHSHEAALAAMHHTYAFITASAQLVPVLARRVSSE